MKKLIKKLALITIGVVIGRVIEKNFTLLSQEDLAKLYEPL